MTYDNDNKILLDLGLTTAINRFMLNDRNT